MKIRKIVLTLLSITLFACTSLDSGNKIKLPERALVEPSQVSAAIALEETLNLRENAPVPAGENWFKVVEGTIPVVITAPHSTRPLREGKRRFSDGGGTAALAIALGELTGAHVLYTTYEGPSDPNYYDNNAFKAELDRLINSVKPDYVLDIHGSHPYRSYDVDVGTMGGQSLLGNKELLPRLIEHLNQEGIFSVSLNRFDASKHQTIAKFSALKGIPALQLEINATYVMPSAGSVEAQRFSRLLQALARFVGSKK